MLVRAKRYDNNIDMDVGPYLEYYGIRTGTELQNMSPEDRRNTMIVEINKRRPFYSIKQLQGMHNSQLASIAVQNFG